jgi:Zn-dependent metalloprotease
VCHILHGGILSKVVKNGNKDERAVAADTMAHDMALRANRHANALMRPLIQTAFAAPSVLTKRRTIYDAGGNQNDGDDKVVFKEADASKPSKDVMVNEAFIGSGQVYDFYKQVFGRESIDNRGLALDSHVHYGRAYDNAFWDGEKMVYGDGDGSLFNRFTISLDIIGHELTHGVVEKTCNLVYQGQSGALNEHIADVFGSMVKQWVRKETAAQADWIIGEGLLAKGVKGVGLRSLKAPGTAYDDRKLGKDDQPAHMRNYWNSREDNGGVHVNSGIPNRAFYLFATDLGGSSWEQAGKVWYTTLSDSRIKNQCTFQDFCSVTVQNANRLYGHDSQVSKALRSAWKSVGLNPVE